MSKSKNALQPGDPAEQAPAEQNPPMQAAPEESPPAQDDQAGAEAPEAAPAQDDQKGNEQSAEGQEQGREPGKEGSGEGQKEATGAVIVAPLTGEILPAELNLDEPTVVADKPGDVPATIEVDPNNQAKAVQAIKEMLAKAHQTDQLAEASAAKTMTLSHVAVMSYRVAGAAALKLCEIRGCTLNKLITDEGLERNRCYRGADYARFLTVEECRCSVRDADKLVRQYKLAEDTRALTQHEPAKAGMLDAGTGTQQQPAQQRTNKHARKGKKGPGRPPGPPVYRPLPPDPVAKCETGRNDGAKYTSNALLGIAGDAVRTAVVDDSRGKVTEDEVLYLAADLVNWTNHDEVDRVDDWSLLRDKLKDSLDEFFAAFLAYSKHLPPVFIVQAAAEVLKYARMRLDKVNAWDSDKDKLEDAIVDMRDYMAKIDSSVPPGV